jgi:hypothetical protein
MKLPYVADAALVTSFVGMPRAITAQDSSRPSTLLLMSDHLAATLNW